MNYPHNDTKLEYDFQLHRYVLTPLAVELELGIKLELLLNTAFDANPSAAVTRFLKKASNMVYNFIYEHSFYPTWMEYLMAKHMPLRVKILQMLIAQADYMLQNGVVSDYSGINIAKGTYMELDRIRGAAKIADEVIQIASQPIEGLGYCLLFTGATPRLARSELYKEY